MIAPPIPIGDLEFHHIGVACRNLDREVSTFAALGYSPEGTRFEDPIQGIRGCFLNQGGPRIELVAPLGNEQGVLTNLLASGIKMYHLAYLTSNLEGALNEAIRLRAKVVTGPVPAVAFNGRRISFLFLPNMMLVELIEK